MIAARLATGILGLVLLSNLLLPVAASAQSASQTPPASRQNNQGLTAPQLPAALAQAGDFYLQVTPSPLVTTLKPGTTTELELKVRNAGSATEELKIEPRSFKLNDDSGQVTLDDTTPPDIAQWISFAAPTFTIQRGEWFTQKIRIAVPKDTGFSYSFALLISRKNNPNVIEGGRLIKGSLAVFTLVNIDRPGATRKLEVAGFTKTKKVYEYLPAELKISLKNSGNSIVQPYGNIYIQRGANDAEPISTLPVNDNRSYILPGSVRTLQAQWQAGFPAYQDGKLVWDWGKAADFRIGKYTAKLVAVYNDGSRDVPVESTVSFWVFPWKIVLGFVVVILLILFAVGSIVWKFIKLGKRRKARRAAKRQAAPAGDDETA